MGEESPICEIKTESGVGRHRTAHHNLLLPCNDLPFEARPGDTRKFSTAMSCLVSPQASNVKKDSSNEESEGLSLLRGPKSCCRTLFSFNRKVEYAGLKISGEGTWNPHTLRNKALVTNVGKKAGLLLSTIIMCVCEFWIDPPIHFACNKVMKSSLTLLTLKKCNLSSYNNYILFFQKKAGSNWLIKQTIRYSTRYLSLVEYILAKFDFQKSRWINY